MRNLAVVTQEHPMGCGVACVASVLGLTYQEAHKLFSKKHGAWSEGYYLPEIVEALSAGGQRYTFKEITSQNDPVLDDVGVIVFCQPCEAYPEGHYLVNLSAKRKWMNPWANYPCITPAEAGIVSTLPSPVSWAAYKL